MKIQALRYQRRIVVRQSDEVESRLRYQRAAINKHILMLRD